MASIYSRFQLYIVMPFFAGLNIVFFSGRSTNIIAYGTNIVLKTWCLYCTILLHVPHKVPLLNSLWHVTRLSRTRAATATPPPSTAPPAFRTALASSVRQTSCLVACTTWPSACRVTSWPLFEKSTVFEYSLRLKKSIIYSQSHKGLPLRMSNPHFLSANPYYLSAIDGLSPKKELHETFIAIEPVHKTSLGNISIVRYTMPDNMTGFLENAGYRKDTFGCQTYTDQRLRDSFVIGARLLPAEPKWDHISNHVGRGGVFISTF